MEVDQHLLFHHRELVSEVSKYWNEFLITESHLSYKGQEYKKKNKVGEGRKTRNEPGPRGKSLYALDVVLDH